MRIRTALRFRGMRFRRPIDIIRLYRGVAVCVGPVIVTAVKTGGAACLGWSIINLINGPWTWIGSIG